MYFTIRLKITIRKHILSKSWFFFWTRATLVTKCYASHMQLLVTLSPLALLMARSGLSTRQTRRIFTTDIASLLKYKPIAYNLPSLMQLVPNSLNWIKYVFDFIVTFFDENVIDMYSLQDKGYKSNSNNE